MTRSHRIIRALSQLEQFLSVQSPGEGEVICALTGVRVSAIADSDGTDHGQVRLTFPGAEPVEAIGELYLKLRIIEAVRLEFDGDGETSDVSRRVRDLQDHLKRKYDL